jgi:hypothetical protein
VYTIDYFKSKHLKNNIHDSGNGNRWIKYVFEHPSHKKQLGRQEKIQFFNREKYLNEHSRDIAGVVYTSWTKHSGLFAWCKY